MKKPPSRVGIIILNWNGWKDTIECLESIYQINYLNYNIILIDNNSNDDSIEKIKEYCNGKIEVNSNFFQYDTSNKPIKIFEYTENEFKTAQKDEKEISNTLPTKKIILIKNNENYGFAGGNNRGIKYAVDIFKSDYILLLNNDTVVDSNFLIELVEAAEEDEKIGFVGAKTYFYSKKGVIQAAGGGKINLKKVIAVETASNQIDNGEYDQNCELDYITGSCILCKKEVLDEIGMLNVNYFMYWEDVDWCFRGRKSGFKSVYAFKSKIWHKVSVSSTNYLKTYYCTRNRIYFMEQNINNSNNFKFLSYFFIYIFLPQIIAYLLNQDLRGGFKPYLNGFISGLKLHSSPIRTGKKYNLQDQDNNIDHTLNQIKNPE